MSFRPCFGRLSLGIRPDVRLRAVVIALALLLAPAASQANQSGLDDWRVLHSFERQALDDYVNHRSTSDVVQRGQLLMTIARSPSFSGLGANCRRAAETLSYMVSGYYWSAQRLEVAADWHHYRRPYMAQRAACLQDLGIDAQAFPLPFWFTRG